MLFKIINQKQRPSSLMPGNFTARHQRKETMRRRESCLLGPEKTFMPQRCRRCAIIRLTRD